MYSFSVKTYSSAKAGRADKKKMQQRNNRNGERNQLNQSELRKK